MPRIDPQQLLNCLQVLLTPSGGILSKDEVQRLANLMTKFSKKLVSKCIYVLILKNTDKQLLGSFMGEGGWNLIHIWLQDAHLNKNWALVTEVLQLLLITPVDVERLKMNNLPKLVKSLTKREDLPSIQKLATSLVEEWLKIVKDVTKAETTTVTAQPAIEVKPIELIQVVEEIKETPMDVDEEKTEGNNTISENTDNTLRFKVALKDGIQVISKIVPTGEENIVPVSSNVESSKETTQTETDKDKKDDKKKEKSNHDRSKHRSSSSSSKSSSSRDKDRSSRDKSRSSSSSKSSSSKDKDRKDRDRHRSNGSSSKSKSSSSKTTSKDKQDTKESKEKQAEKDKDTLAKIQPQTLQKIGRIPKKPEDKKSSSTSKKEETKKPTFSVEIRKNNEEKPKTVKIFNSKMRSTGLLEEAKPPPPRTTPKKPTAPLPTVIPVKRPSPIRDLIPPPEKKSRLMDPPIPDRPGAIKLIPPKPKPAVLQESDIFMDALTASATAKKEPKKRKRRASVSKESSPPSSPASATPTSPTTNIKNITPANFYQDTLETEKDEEKDKENEEEKKEEIPDTPAEPDEEVKETTRTDANGLKGVLSYSKRKGPKRCLRWRPDTELVEIQYFELDETERVNVMKPFMDMARMEMSSEREALRSRKLPNEDNMDTQMSWRELIELDIPPPQTEIGSKSLEKEIQFAREKRVLQVIYFNNRVPDTPVEPDVETHPIVNAIIIPLEDPDNPEQDTPIQPWPEPKGSPPHVPNIAPIFTNLPNQFMNMNGPPNPNFGQNLPPPFVQNFIPPNIMPNIRPPSDWSMPNGMPQNHPNHPPPDMMNGPNLFDNFDNNFGPPFNPPNNMPMFPPNNFNNNNMRGRGGFRRGGGGGNGPWLRMTGPGPNQGGWNGRGGGGPTRGGRFCINVKKHGYCRNRDNCPFVHPN